MNCNSIVKNLCWDTERQAITSLRRQVFIAEQGVPEALEWDEFDLSAFHFAIVDPTNPLELIAYGRLLPGGKLTRMAVSRPHRLHGHGTALVEYALRLARSQNLQEVYLDAQITALAFYNKLGFCELGRPFWDAGIEHIAMTKTLT